MHINRVAVDSENAAAAQWSRSTTDDSARTAETSLFKRLTMSSGRMTRARAPARRLCAGGCHKLVLVVGLLIGGDPSILHRLS